MFREIYLQISVKLMATPKKEEKENPNKEEKGETKKRVAVIDLLDEYCDHRYFTLVCSDCGKRQHYTTDDDQAESSSSATPLRPPVILRPCLGPCRNPSRPSATPSTPPGPPLSVKRIKKSELKEEDK